MSKLHVYITPYADDQGTAYGTEVEVTKDVRDLGSLTQALDNNEYDVGVFRANQLKLSLLNHHGRYSDVGAVDTIFKYKRGDSLVRITWEPGDGPLIAGFFTAGHPTAIVSEEIDIFEGLLSDIGTQSKIDDADVDFAVLGYESLLAQMTVPYSSISNGNSLATALYTCLNQAPFNERVTVNSGNITTGAAATIDDKASLENKTVLEAAKQILLASNSVLWIREGVVYTGPRTAGATLAHTFYGPGAQAGIQNLIDIEKYRTGLNRVRNYWTWKDTTRLAQDTSSIATYGTQKREISLDIITNNTKRDTLLGSLKDEFKDPKREMELETWFSPTHLDLFLLDRVAVDYPSVALPVENQRTAQYDVPPGYDSDYYAEELLPLTIESTARFKVMARTINFKDETMKLSLREI